MKGANRLAYYRARIRRHRVLAPAYRVGILVTGGAVAVAGIALLVLPGPGWLLIFAGLAILATEFSWARRTLHWVRDRYQQTRDRLKSGPAHPVDGRSGPGGVG